MNNAKNNLPEVIDNGGVRFHGVDWSGINVCRVQLPAGADAKPLLEGMPHDLCPCPHWGYVLKGSIHVRYEDGREETVRAGEVYYWPPNHTVRTDEDYEAVEFSPAKEMGEVMEHLKSKMRSS